MFFFKVPHVIFKFSFYFLPFLIFILGILHQKGVFPRGEPALDPSPVEFTFLGNF